MRVFIYAAIVATVWTGSVSHAATSTTSTANSAPTPESDRDSTRDQGTPPGAAPSDRNTAQPTAQAKDLASDPIEPTTSYRNRKGDIVCSTEDAACLAAKRTAKARQQKPKDKKEQTGKDKE